MLRPPIEAENAPFWEGCRNGELKMMRCSETHRLIFPPRSFSPWASPTHGTSSRVDQRIRARNDLVIRHPSTHPCCLTTVIAPPTTSFWSPWTKDPTVRLIGNLVNRGGGEINEITHEIEIGARVKVVFERVDDEIHMPRWVLD